MTYENLPQPNIPLLRKAVEWAEAEAAKTDGTCMWNQDSWAQTTKCGTAFCIAGFSVMNSLPNATAIADHTNLLDLFVDGKYVYWHEAGRDTLGLTEDEADELFAPDNSTTDVRRIAEQIAERAGERL